MTALIALVRKDLILYINDKRALMLHLLMPVILAAFFGSLFGGGSKPKPARSKSAWCCWTSRQRQENRRRPESRQRPDHHRPE